MLVGGGVGIGGGAIRCRFAFRGAISELVSTIVGIAEEETSRLGSLFFGGRPRFFGTLPFCFFALALGPAER
jgi:hypothetical protein